MSKKLKNLKASAKFYFVSLCQYAIMISCLLVEHLAHVYSLRTGSMAIKRCMIWENLATQTKLDSIMLTLVF